MRNMVKLREKQPPSGYYTKRSTHYENINSEEALKKIGPDYRLDAFIIISS